MKRTVPEYTFSEEQLNTVRNLAKECNLLEDTVKILFGRGVDDREKIDKFIHPSRSHFISPFKMSGMDEAVKLITLARDEEWCVVVYGDYDADGICASTIMYNALKDFGIQPIVYIPERRDGYGLSKSAVDEIFDEYCPQLFITVDCGISCAEEIEYIKEQGAEVIVTDHHELPATIPDCICINPKFNDGYIYDNLCGAGVALKTAIALNGESAYKYLDFAAIATVADSVPLTGENRDIVFEGLKIINSIPRANYSQLLSRTDAALTAQSVAYGVAPRINAAGRMGDARAALNLFISDDENEIFDLSAKLTAYNIERQKYCDELYLSAKEKIKNRGCGKIIMLWDEGWNTGFVGIVAARLAEEYSRPVVLFVRHGDMLRGSARSIANINVFEALKASENLIAQYGGHAQAAGVTIRVEDFEKLEQALNAYLSANYCAEDFEPTVYTNGKLSSPCSVRFVREIEMLEPFGVGNRRPVFELYECALEVKAVKPNSPHISIKSDNIELMYFNGGEYTYLIESSAPKKFIFEYNLNKFRGKEYVKGFVREIICAGNSGGYCTEEIAANNIRVLAAPETECKVTQKTLKQIDAEAEKFDSSALYIAGSYESLMKYKNLQKLSVGLFNSVPVSLAGAVLISPMPDVDLSGYSRIILIDRPVSGIRYASLWGKDVTVCCDLPADGYLNGVSAERDVLLDIFAKISANAANIKGDDSVSVALKNDMGYSPRQTAFALEVFRQLSLINFEGGRLNVIRGVKTQLTNSELYNTVNDYKGLR